MKKSELTLIVQISVVLAVSIGLGIVFLMKAPLLSSATVRYFSLGLTSVTFFWAFFLRWGWRLPLLNLLFSKPDIDGTWIGTLSTDWVDENGNGVLPMDFVVVVRQTYLDFHVR